MHKKNRFGGVLREMAQENLVRGYLTAKEKIVAAGYDVDIRWAEDLENVKPTPAYVLQEAAWVILNSGFRFTVAKKVWPAVRSAFNGFLPEKVDASCLPAALRALNHEGKMQAIVEIARLVQTDLEGILRDAQDPLKLRRLPFIGPITCYHLAKDLGVDTIKPDVHLKRAAAAVGMDPFQLCQNIKDAIGDRLVVVDAVLWRYGEQMKAQKWPDWEALWGVSEVAP